MFLFHFNLHRLNSHRFNLHLFNLFFLNWFLLNIKNNRTLTDERLLELIEKKRTIFIDDYIFLNVKNVNVVKKCFVLIAVNKNSIKRKFFKTRAHIFLTDIWTHFSEIFLLCSLTTNSIKLKSLKSKSYLRKLLKWWKKIDYFIELTKTVERLSEILSSKTCIIIENNFSNSSNKILRALYLLFTFTNRFVFKLFEMLHANIAEFNDNLINSFHYSYKRENDLNL